MKIGFHTDAFNSAYIIVNIEPHGYFTTKPEYMARMLDFVRSPHLRMNLDTGNTFIAGQDPPAFLERSLKWLRGVLAELRIPVEK